MTNKIKCLDHGFVKLLNVSSAIPRDPEQVSRAALTQARLKELLDYDSSTGEFSRLSGLKGHKAGSKVGSLTHGYEVICIDKKKYYSHRLAFLFMEGRLPKLIDHIDGNGLNNAYANLRECSQSENLANKTNQSNNSSLIKGVCYIKSREAYRARVEIKGISSNRYFKINKYGSTENALLAACTYVQELRQQLHGEFANHG